MKDRSPVDSNGQMDESWLPDLPGVLTQEKKTTKLVRKEESEDDIANFIGSNSGGGSSIGIRDSEGKSGSPSPLVIGGGSYWDGATAAGGGISQKKASALATANLESLFGIGDSDGPSMGHPISQSKPIDLSDAIGSQQNKMPSPMVSRNAHGGAHPGQGNGIKAVAGGKDGGGQYYANAADDKTLKVLEGIMEREGKREEGLVSLYLGK